MSADGTSLLHREPPFVSYDAPSASPAAVRAQSQQEAVSIDATRCGGTHFVYATVFQ